MGSIADNLTSLRTRIRERAVPPELETRLNAMLETVERLAGDISAYVHIEQMLSYIDWAVSLPWNERSIDSLDLTGAHEIFNRHHYGLEPVKDRIIEYLAVLKLQTSIAISAETGEQSTDASLTHGAIARRAPILCLVGLVGTGKTTLAKSIALAMGRKFVRIPFGGMSDALELRGQSRVRPDAEIGMVLKGLRQAGTKNPVILLDEIDRVAEHARGDIMGVLVELLDPEQNKAFRDHYLDFPFDLSEVLFVATSNNTTNIATAVLDRLEPITMPSYTDEEKITIAKNYVMPELLQSSGLPPEAVVIDEGVWPKLVRPLGYDAGIRSIERTLNGICRKAARMKVEGRGDTLRITEENMKQYMEMY
jgi:ATP-dependent Lon protease